MAYQWCGPKLTMSGVLSILLAAAKELLRTTITVGDDGVVVNSGYTLSVYGSIANATYTDTGGNSRTIQVVIWNSTNISLFLSAAGISNSDTTFSRITLTGPGGNVTLFRSAATYNGAASGGTKSSWIWSSAVYPGSSGQSVTLAVS